MRHRALTLADLLVVMLIVCLATSVLLSGPYLRMREVAQRVACASHLRQIGQAIMLYANENKGAYPRTHYQVDDAPTQLTGSDCKNPFEGEGRPNANDVTAAIFLLVRTQDFGVEIFVCPSTDSQPFDRKDKSVQEYANFGSALHLGYSMANPYPDRRAVDHGYRLNSATDAEFAVFADMNPGKFESADVTPASGPRGPDDAPEMLRKGNSQNHRGEGQNVLYGDGRVMFHTTPFVGVKEDNIYTVSGATTGDKPTSATIIGSPAWQGDSVLLPVATIKPHLRTIDEEERRELVMMRRDLAEMEQRLGTAPPAAADATTAQAPKLSAAAQSSATTPAEVQTGGRATPFVTGMAVGGLAGAAAAALVLRARRG